MDTDRSGPDRRTLAVVGGARAAQARHVGAYFSDVKPGGCLDRAVVEPELRGLIENGPLAEVALWLPELQARFQMVDDVCLSSARR